MKKLLSSLLAAALTAGLLVPSAGAVDTGFSDVPAESALAGEVRKAVDYGLMNGYDNDTFGYGDSMTRAQFTAVLVRLHRRARLPHLVRRHRDCRRPRCGE